MIYLLIAVLLPVAWRFFVLGRRRGALHVAKVIVVAALLGLLAGVSIGAGARVGMSAITVANGETPSFTLAGSFNVVATFASFGIILGIVYEGLFRQLLRGKGLAYGALLTLCSWYPLAHAAAQQLTKHPSVIPLVVVSGVMVALMWLPYGVALEALLRKWQTRRVAPEMANAVA